MINASDLDRLMTNHAALIAHVNREGWRRGVSTSSDTRIEVATVVQRRRKSAGLVLIRIGAWLHGAANRHASDSATAS
jgi:hypothetical protein